MHQATFNKLFASDSMLLWCQKGLLLRIGCLLVFIGPYWCLLDLISAYWLLIGCLLVLIGAYWMLIGAHGVLIGPQSLFEK